MSLLIQMFVYYCLYWEYRVIRCHNFLAETSHAF